MVERGFEIQDMLAVKRTQFIFPKRKTAEDQFSKDECLETMRIANLCIHVERAIKRVKGWHIFDQVLPLSIAGVVNEVWTVCCLLTKLVKACSYFSVSFCCHKYCRTSGRRQEKTQKNDPN